MADSTTFKEKQYAFAAHIRDPDHVAAPEGIESRRMAIYRSLFFNNLYNLLATFFPVLRKIHSDAQWRRFIRGFMQHHQAETPYFLRATAGVPGVSAERIRSSRRRLPVSAGTRALRVRGTGTGGIG